MGDQLGLITENSTPVQAIICVGTSEMRSQLVASDAVVGL